MGLGGIALPFSMLTLRGHTKRGPTSSTPHVAVLLILLVIGMPTVGEWAIPSACTHSAHGSSESDGAELAPRAAAEGHAHSPASADEPVGPERAPSHHSAPNPTVPASGAPTLVDAGGGDCGHCPPDECALNTGCAAAAYGIITPHTVAYQERAATSARGTELHAGPLDTRPVPTTPPPRIAA